MLDGRPATSTRTEAELPGTSAFGSFTLAVIRPCVHVRNSGETTSRLSTKRRPQPN